MSHGMKVLGLVVAVCAAVAGNLEILPPALLFLAAWLKLAGFVGGIVMAYLIVPTGATSDSDTSSSSSAKKLALFLALAIGASSLTGCALLKIKPGSQASAQQLTDKNAEIAKTALVIERIGLAVKAVQSTEIAYHNAGRISNAEHVTFQGYLVKWADAMLTLKPGLEDLTKPEASRRDLVNQAIKLTDTLIANGLVPVNDQAVKLEIRIALGQIQALLPTLELLIH